MDGAGIKPGTVGHRQLGRHSVSGANLVKNSIGITNLNGALQRQVNRRARVTLPSQSGTPGAKGSTGPQGAVGAAGPAGAKADTGAAAVRPRWAWQRGGGWHERDCRLRDPAYGSAAGAARRSR